MSNATIAKQQGTVIKDIAVGDVFSEVAHLRVESVNRDTVNFLHVESKQSVKLSHEYVKTLLKTADQFSTEKQVTKEDGQSGLGIRSIFENIGNEVFTVCFVKQGKAKTQKAITAEKNALIQTATAKLSTKGRLSNAAISDIIAEVIDSPVSTEEAGEDRVLRGYKIQHVSRDGKYDCVDMDITTGMNVRPVNINTIKWIVVDGVKYTVK